MKSRQECIEAAGAALAASVERQNALTPRQAAERAHRPGGPSVAELEARIRAQREQADRTAA